MTDDVRSATDALADASGGGPTEGERLAELARAVRESTLKRLRRVPAGAANWRPAPEALSVADLAHHLLHADDWLAAKLAQPSLAGMVAHAGEAGTVDDAAFHDLVERLERAGEARARRLAAMSAADLATRIPDDRFGGEVTVWWVIVRGNLDHEAHHRGQLATYLRLLAGRES